MATIKAYTDLSQSKKLTEILPLESADMCYLPTHIGDEHHFIACLSSYSMCTKMTEVSIEYCTPCWSLASLLSVLPDTITSNDGIAFKLNIKKSIIEYSNPSLYLVYKSVKANNLIDACVAMIERLHELKML